MAAGDAFVVMQPLTEAGTTMFGKNSSRPKGEVQEVVYVKGEAPYDGKIKCTHIEIEAPTLTPLSVILSKPGWCWGADMGANDKGVAIGTALHIGHLGVSEHEDSPDYLVPLDLVRLGLEQGQSADAAVDRMGHLVETYGAIGEGIDLPTASYVIADPKEVWILSTAGRMWAAEKITSGYKRIATDVSVNGVDKSSENLSKMAQDLGLWDGQGDFKFSVVFGKGSENVSWPKDAPKNEGAFSITDMFQVLRDKDSGICRDRDSDYPIQSSQVSMLSVNRPSCHWFTGTPDPSVSVYKPFVFTPDARVSHLTISDQESDHMHGLYKLHAAGTGDSTAALLRDLESACVTEVRTHLYTNSEEFGPGELDDLMKDCVEAEVKFYR